MVRPRIRQLKTAGFESIEIHGVNGYLLNQFLITYFNKRDDSCGGSLENILRLTVKVTVTRAVPNMQDKIAAANRASAVFYDAYITMSRKRVEGLSRVVNPLFARMHANRVFDRINLGDGNDFLYWLVDAGDQQLDPGKDFSQGQRQNLALALFLARARSLGGTFFRLTD